MTCQQPSYHDPMRECPQPSFGLISPGSLWARACWHHYGKARRKGWLVKR